MIIREVCVLGGSGFVGRHLCHALVSRGLRVRVPTRDRERAKALITLPTVDVLEADIHDTEQLKRLVRGCDAVINLVGVLHDGRSARSFVASHVELVRKTVDACRQLRVRRLLHMSAIGADANGPSEYVRTKAQGERVVRESGLDFTIFRPSVIFGREDSFLNLFARLQGVFPVMPLGSPNARFQPVYVLDVAAVFATALTRLDSVGKIYELGGPQVYTLRELVAYTGELTGKRRPIVPLGKGLSYLQALVAEHLPGKLLTRDNYRSMQVDNVTAERLPFGIEATALESVAPAWLAGRTPRSRYHQFRRRSRADAA